MRDYVTVVSGLPRSGTSLMMRMLESGGIPALTDKLRPPDVHNPHGYFEYGPVRRLAEDSSWMTAARGKSIKIIYRLLPCLPPDLEYRVIFMERDLKEVFESQSDLLHAKGDPAADQNRGLLIRAFAAELRGTKQWLARRPEIRVLNVPYAGVVGEPVQWAREVARFLDGGDDDLDEAAMAAAVDPSLYRHHASDTGIGLP